MSKSVITALAIIAISALVFIFNRGSVDVNLLVTEVSGLKSVVFLAWTAVGVVIGVLLK